MRDGAGGGDGSERDSVSNKILLQLDALHGTGGDDFTFCLPSRLFRSDKRVLIFLSRTTIYAIQRARATVRLKRKFKGREREQKPDETTPNVAFLF